MKLFENDWCVYGFTNASDGNAKNEEVRRTFFSRAGLLETNFVCGNQSHEDRIVIVKDLSQKLFAETDGFATDQPGIVLGVFTADCVPVVLTESEHHIAAVIHAGWRGTVKRIAEKGIKILQDHWKIEAKNLKVHLGPCIQDCCYSVGKETAEYFPSESVAITGENRFLKLQKTLEKQLAELGVPTSNIKKDESCTCCGTDFFSYRKNGTKERMCAFVSRVR